MNFKNIYLTLLFAMMVGVAYSQTTGTSSTTGGTTTGTTSLINQGTYDSKTLVDTNSTSNSVSTVNSNSTAVSNSNATSNSTVNSTSVNTNIIDFWSVRSCPTIIISTYKTILYLTNGRYCKWCCKCF